MQLVILLLFIQYLSTSYDLIFEKFKSFQFSICIKMYLNYIQEDICSGYFKD